MVFSISLQAHERALLIRDGRPARLLGPGRHRLWTWGAELTSVTYNLDTASALLTPELQAVLPPDAADVFEVADGHLGLISVDDRPFRVLAPGRYALWKGRARVQGALLSLAPVLGEVPSGFASLMPAEQVEEALVMPHERVLLMVDGALHTVLGSGRHFVFKDRRKIQVVWVDLREREVQIAGQEVLTADKASIRVNIVLKYRISDAVLATQAVVDLAAGLYSEAQLVYRHHVAQLTVEQLLERRGAGDAMRLALAERAHTWGVEILQLDLKDIVLPGEMKALFNRVIEAEKQAQAQNILRREETASTRSLANTAKLLESNPTLLRLKELETWKEMAGKVGQVTVVVSPQQLAGQLGLRLPGEER
jgi:regulator of protease activity HflC (stomatin/prohibitin superfamily)